jgi:WD40 repeat protein
LAALTLHDDDKEGSSKPVNENDKEEQEQEQGNSTATTTEEETSTLDPNPLNTSGDSQSDNDSFPVFTDEELVAALISLDDDDDDEGLFSNEDLLPEIEVDFDNELNDFIDPEKLDSVFDLDDNDNESDDTKSSHPLVELQVLPVETEETAETQLAFLDGKSEDEPQKVGDDEEFLLQELANLSLDTFWNPNNQDDNLPSYLYCQPCSIQSGDFSHLTQQLPAISEAEPLSDQNAIVDRAYFQSEAANIQQDQSLEELLQLSLLSLGNDEPHFLDEMESDLQAEHDHHHEGVEHLHNGEQQQLSQAQAPPQLFVRRKALVAAQSILEAFSADERSCLGHKETIYGVTFSDSGKFCATASQDATINVWDVEKNALLTTLKEHSKDYECLRVAWASSTWAQDSIDRTGNSSVYRHLLASGGADGTVKIWGCQDPAQKDTWQCHATLDHSKLLGRDQKKDENKDEKESPKEDNKPQIYALQFIDHWKAFTDSDNDSSRNSFLMTSSDDYIHMWEVETEPIIREIPLDGDISSMCQEFKLKEVMSLHFTEMEHYAYGVTVCNVTGSGLQVPAAPPTDSTSSSNAFGGERNQSNVIFVFDAAYCSANGLLGVALSDGSLRLVNGRGICVSILNLPGCQSHLTSFCWDSTGSRLATSVATGHLISWEIDEADGDGNVVATCAAIMEGGMYRQCCREMSLRIHCRQTHNPCRSPARATIVWLTLLRTQRDSSTFLGCGRPSLSVGFGFGRQCEFPNGYFKERRQVSNLRCRTFQRLHSCGRRKRGGLRGCPGLYVQFRDLRRRAPGRRAPGRRTPGRRTPGRRAGYFRRGQRWRQGASGD